MTLRLRRCIPVGFVAMGLALLALPASSRAATSLEGATFSPDITVSLNGIVIPDEAVADDDLAGGVAAVAFPGIPAAASLGAYQLLEEGAELLVFETTLRLPGGITATPRDVVRLEGGVYSLAFQGAGVLPPGSAIDALATADDGELLLSFDVTLSLSGQVFEDEDLARLDGGSFSLFFDGSARGVPPGADLDGAHRLQNDHLLLSFDVGGSVGGVAFDDEDALQFNPRNGSFSLAFDGSALHPELAAADLAAFDALAADSDADGLRDDEDNCVLAPNGPASSVGAPQRDSDGDGYGNRCDADLDQSLVVNFADLAILRQVFFTLDPDADFDGDGVVNFADLATMRSAFFQPPGPSAFAP